MLAAIGEDDRDFVRGLDHVSSSEDFAILRNENAGSDTTHGGQPLIEPWIDLPLSSNDGHYRTVNPIKNFVKRWLLAG